MQYTHAVQASIWLTQAERGKRYRSWLKRERNFAQKWMRTHGAATRRFMRHFFNKCDYGAGRVVILIPVHGMRGTSQNSEGQIWPKFDPGWTDIRSRYSMSIHKQPVLCWDIKRDPATPRLVVVARIIKERRLRSPHTHFITKFSK